MRLVIAITGASGSIYGIRLLECLRPRKDIETHLILSATAIEAEDRSQHAGHGR